MSRHPSPFRDIVRSGGALPAAVAFAALCLQGCSVYYNTYFNAAKAHRMAVAAREDRLRENPDDSVAVSSSERALLVRAVTKSSKVLELWPDDPKYAPKAVFLIAESQFLMEDYGSAAIKYDEYIRYFPDGENIPLARVRLAQSLYRDGKTLAARDALQEALAGNPEGEAHREAMLLAARMRIDEEDGREGFALYEQLLNEGAFPTPEGRNEARWRAAVLAFEIGAWEKARTYALAAGEGDVPSRILFRNGRLAVLALYRMDRPAEGLAEVRAMQGRKEFRAYRQDLKVLEARAFEILGDWDAARGLYRDAVKMEPRTAASGEAWYRLGTRALDVDDDEAAALPLFDSAAASGPGTEFGRLGEERVQALRRLGDLRRQAADSAAIASDSARPHYADFMIAELFRFDLPKPDSARVYLRGIASDSVIDTAYTPRALYAWADLERSEFAEDDGRRRADSLYRVILARYPATEWAKQSERYLGLPPVAQTPEDSAHAAFLRAETRRLSGGDPLASAPLYRAVAETWPATATGARARFVLGVLAERRALERPDAPGRLDSVKAAWKAVAERYPGTRYAEVAGEKLNALETPVDSTGQPLSSGESSGDSRGSGETIDADEESVTPAVPRPDQVDTGEEQDLY